jgi:hypothetical protein
MPVLKQSFTFLNKKPTIIGNKILSIKDSITINIDCKEISAGQKEPSWPLDMTKQNSQINYC